MIRIETDRLVIRAFCEKDLEPLAALTSDPEMMKFISPALSREIVKEVVVWVRSEWDRLGYGWFALFEKERGAFVGQCGLQKLEGKREGEEVEVTFAISPPFWGKGYATEAARAVLEFGFSNVGLEEIFAVTVNENIPSQRVLKKLGFKYEGIRNVHQRPVNFYSLEKKIVRHNAICRIRK